MTRRRVLVGFMVCELALAALSGVLIVLDALSERSALV